MEKLRKERHELFMERKRQQANVRRLEWKMHRLREVRKWLYLNMAVKLIKFYDESFVISTMNGLQDSNRY